MKKKNKKTTLIWNKRKEKRMSHRKHDQQYIHSKFCFWFCLSVLFFFLFFPILWEVFKTHTKRPSSASKISKKNLKLRIFFRFEIERLVRYLSNTNLSCLLFSWSCFIFHENFICLMKYFKHNHPRGLGALYKVILVNLFRGSLLFLFSNEIKTFVLLLWNET